MGNPRKFVRRVQVLEAMQVQPDKIDELIEWSRGAVSLPEEVPAPHLLCATPDGVVNLQFGSWCVRSTAGDYHPVHASMFDQLYSPLENRSTESILVKALRQLTLDITSQDGIPNAVCWEAADHIERLEGTHRAALARAHSEINTQQTIILAFYIALKEYKEILLTVDDIPQELRDELSSKFELLTAQISAYLPGEVAS